MIEYHFRQAYQKIFVDPIAAFFIRFTRITPNKVTLLALFLGILAAIFNIFHWAYAAVVLLLLSGYCDSLDGTLARLAGHATPRGAALDIVSDRVVEFIIIFSLYWMSPVHNAIGALCMLGASELCVTTFLVVGIFSENYSEKSFNYSVGLMERPEAFAFFIAMILLPAYFQWLAICYSVLVVYTAVIRIRSFWKASLRYV